MDCLIGIDAHVQDDIRAFDQLRRFDQGAAEELKFHRRRKHGGIRLGDDGTRVTQRQRHQVLADTRHDCFVAHHQQRKLGTLHRAGDLRDAFVRRVHADLSQDGRRPRGVLDLLVPVVHRDGHEGRPIGRRRRDRVGPAHCLRNPVGGRGHPSPLREGAHRSDDVADLGSVIGSHGPRLRLRGGDDEAAVHDLRRRQADPRRALGG